MIEDTKSENWVRLSSSRMLMASSGFSLPDLRILLIWIDAAFFGEVGRVCYFNKKIFVDGGERSGQDIRF
jgi:hypothetical protein